MRLKAMWLRHRLQKYYAWDRRTAPVLIDLPKGGYRAPTGSGCSVIPPNPTCARVVPGELNKRHEVSS